MVKLNMTAKLLNSKLEEKSLRKKRGQLRSKLESMVGSKSHGYRSYVRKINERMYKLCDEIKRKNKVKVSWLKSKVEKRLGKFILPEGWSRYKDLKRKT